MGNRRSRARRQLRAPLEDEQPTATISKAQGDDAHALLDLMLAGDYVGIGNLAERLRGAGGDEFMVVSGVVIQGLYVALEMTNGDRAPTLAHAGIRAIEKAGPSSG